jgi:hypothetical protein
VIGSEMIFSIRVIMIDHFIDLYLDQLVLSIWLGSHFFFNRSQYDHMTSFAFGLSSHMITLAKTRLFLQLKSV